MKKINGFKKKQLNVSKRFKGGASPTCMGQGGYDRKRKNGRIITNTGDWNPFNNDIK